MSNRLFQRLEIWRDGWVQRLKVGDGGGGGVEVGVGVGSWD